MFNEFALEHAWLIPLLPAISFVIIGMVTRSYGKLSAAIAVSFPGSILAVSTSPWVFLLIHLRL